MELAVKLVNLIAVIAIVTGLAFVVWWVVGLYGVRSRRAEEQQSHVELPAHIHESSAKVPPVLIMFYIFIVAWMIGYMIYTWIARVTY